jgi:hypothetical protein
MQIMESEMSMKTEPQDGKKPSISFLISGIIQDAVVLISKEITAARLELHEELGKAKSAALLIGFGAGALAIGTVLLCLMAVHLLQALTGFQLWICYAVVGGSVTGAGIIILFSAKRRASAANLAPARSIENAKEDARWITHKVKQQAK